MNQFTIVAGAIGGLLLLFFILLWVHAFIARAFGAETGTKTRVLLAGILTNIFFFVSALILTNTIFPDLGTMLVNDTSDAASDASRSTLQTIILIAAPIIAVIVTTLIFSLCVRLGLIKSFVTLLLGGLISTMFVVVSVFGLGMLGFDQQQLLQTLQSQPEEVMNNVESKINNPSRTQDKNTKIHQYLGSHQSKRLAMQQMAQDVCSCDKTEECVSDTFETYRMFANRHQKSYPDDRIGFLDELEEKVSFCAGDLNPELVTEVPITTDNNLENAIRQYHDELGKWAGTYEMTDIIKQENRRQKDGSYIANVRYSYTPTENSERKSNGIGNRTFDYSKNEDGSYSVSAMGDQDSARFIKPENKGQAIWHPVSISALSNYDGVRLRVTRIVGEPLEGSLVGLTNNHVILFIKRRDGEIGYEIERDNVSRIEAWY